ncbi:unnamed protein product [Rhizoctonia solani]|uniref:VWFA domain-containing protein n=1 Tax=Rhizoctonia solani TaxID=456999 RepID=A0A8H2WM43_9AGAM|nr:unnamed protein product [Rhizoctonia solani]
MSSKLNAANIQERYDSLKNQSRALSETLKQVENKKLSMESLNARTLKQKLESEARNQNLESELSLLVQPHGKSNVLSGGLDHTLPGYTELAMPTVITISDAEPTLSLPSNQSLESQHTVVYELAREHGKLRHEVEIKKENITKCRAEVEAGQHEFEGLHNSLIELEETRAYMDPYSREQQAEFAKCDAMCPGPEHNVATGGTNPSYCDLPIFDPLQARRTTPTNGYISADGHHFDSVNPARLHQAYHVCSVFVIDSSGSTGSKDRAPLANTHVSQLLRAKFNNRVGQATTQPRRDAYYVITFNEHPTLTNDFTNTTDELLSHLVQTSAGGGTNFNSALELAQTLIQTHWNSDK